MAGTASTGAGARLATARVLLDVGDASYPDKRGPHAGGGAHELKGALRVGLEAWQALTDGWGKKTSEAPDGGRSLRGGASLDRLHSIFSSSRPHRSAAADLPGHRSSRVLAGPTAEWYRAANRPTMLDGSRKSNRADAPKVRA